MRHVIDALRRFLNDHVRARIEARNLELLNRADDKSNAEAAEVLEYQAPSRASNWWN